MRVVEGAELFRAVARSQGVSATDQPALLRQLLRRSASMLAPAARAAVLASVVEPLAPLGLGDDGWEAAEAALEDLLIYGDLIELRPDRDVPDVIRPAPPTFVRHVGMVFLLGVAGEHASALPPDLASRVDHSSAVRRIATGADEDLAATLAILGLQELPMSVWLRAPAAEGVGAFLGKWRQRLETAGRPSEDLPQLQVLARAGDARHYAGRWETPGPRHTGVFITRRPHAYGGRIWALAEFADGRPRRLLDLEGEGRHQRACDIAWRLSAALDAEAGVGQRVAVARKAAEVQLMFNSPIPSFAERRLSVLGRKQAAPGALFAFVLPQAGADAELATLRELLWVEVASAGEPPR